MECDIAVYIPNYNGEEKLRQLKILDGIDYVVLDNCSTDHSVQVCKEKGMIVVEQKENVGRVGNWLNCINHFKKSKYKWMKWLFIGDKLSDQAAEIMKASVKKYPSASVIIFNYNVIYEGHTELMKSLCGYGQIKYRDIICGLLTKGNIFGSPTGILLSKKAVMNEFHTNGFQWIADVYLTYQMLKNGSCVFVDKTIGTFSVKNRSYYSAKQTDIETYIEEMEFIRLVGSEHNDLYKKYYNVIMDRYENFIINILIHDTKYPVIGKLTARLKRIGIKI